MRHHRFRTALVLGLAAALCAPLTASAQTTEPDLRLVLDARDSGKVFDGIGGAIGGGTSRLLYDYPEPQRGEVLDYLFKPGFGAQLTDVKIDMGGDANQGAGGEPSTRHEPDDENYQRGIQLWLATEAKRRNPAITITALQTAPGWVGGYFTQANIDQIVRWLKGIKQHWGLTVDYFGGTVNEPYIIKQVVDWDWVKRLDQAINSHGLRTKLVVGDDPVRRCCPTYLPWKAAEAMRDDPELRARVDILGSHYAGGVVPDYAHKLGARLWSTEDGPWTDEWNKFRGGSYSALGSTYNRNYVTGRMTGTQVWTAISGYYDNQLLPNSGMVRAGEPWSGHYRPMSPLWITAHTNQFAKPGWRYLDGGSRLLPKGGSVVSLKSPRGNDYSAIIETQRDANNEVPTQAQTVEISTRNGLADSGVVRVWKSTKDDWFLRQPDIPVVGGSYRITLDPDAVYSITTTTGQGKGSTTSPPSKPFPKDHRDDFETGQPHQQPKYLAQQAGSYEITPCTGRPGRCVEQAVRHQPIEWTKSHPVTFLGDSQGWRDVSVSTRMLHRQPGAAEVWARIGNAGASGNDTTIPSLPDGYYLSVQQTGRWELGYAADSQRHRLAAGHTELPASAWHSMRITVRGTEITAEIDDRQVGRATDGRYASGRAGIGTGWNRVQFDDLAVTELRPH